MYRNLRILFCLLAVACAAVTIFIFVYFLWWGFVPLGGAVAFGGLMVVCKRAQEREEAKKNPPPREGDFITGKVPVSKKDEPENKWDYSLLCDCSVQFKILRSAQNDNRCHTERSEASHIATLCLVRFFAKAQNDKKTRCGMTGKVNFIKLPPRQTPRRLSLYLKNS